MLKFCHRGCPKIPKQSFGAEKAFGIIPKQENFFGFWLIWAYFRALLGSTRPIFGLFGGLWDPYWEGRGHFGPILECFRWVRDPFWAFFGDPRIFWAHLGGPRAIWGCSRHTLGLSVADLGLLERGSGAHLGPIQGALSSYWASKGSWESGFNLSMGEEMWTSLVPQNLPIVPGPFPIVLGPILGGAQGVPRPFLERGYKV